MKPGMRIGYVRVSTIDQKVDRQLNGIKLDKVFTDKISGKIIDREQFNLMMDFIREGDILIVHSMDRLARNLDHLRSIVSTLTKKGVSVQFIKESLTFTGEDSPMAHLLLSVMGAISEFEHSLIKERQREGIAIAKTKGAYKGRKRNLNSDQIKQLKEWVEMGKRKTWIAQQLNLERTSIYRYLKR